MDYRKPTVKEKEKLEKSREMMVQGIEGEKDVFSKLMPTMAKAARDEMRSARALRESVPARAREGEAYEYAGYKKGGKVAMKKAKRYNEGGMSLEEKYPEAKITRLPPQSKPAESSPKTAHGQMSKEARETELKKSLEKAAMPEYERKAEKFGRSGSGGAGIPKSGRIEMLKFKSGGKVKSASVRADGCAIRGKTRA